ncbi:hypothetical protein K435DRAFT_621761, partial [Dendrothele bispora CBS 962.96]
RQASDPPADPPSPSHSPKKPRTVTSSFKRTFRAHDHAGKKLSRCPLCLGIYLHNIKDCQRETLWDNKTPARCKRNARGHLENPDGLEICTNWQTRNGCTHTKHPNMHECS